MLTLLSNALIKVAVIELLENAFATPTMMELLANAPSAPTNAPMLESALLKNSWPLRLAAPMPLLGMLRSKQDVCAILADAVLIARYVRICFSSGVFCKLINISPSCEQLNAPPVLMCSKVTVTRLVVIALAVVCVTTLQAFAAASTATTAPSASTKPCWVNRPAASRLLTTNYNQIFINQYIKITCVWRVLLESARGDRSGSSRRC